MQEEKMREQLQEVAARIRNLREIMGISVDTMARRVEVTVADYKEYESGNRD